MTAAAVYAHYLLIIVIHSALCAMLPWLAGRLGIGTQAGVLSGVAGAVILGWWPPGAETLAAIVLSLMLIVFLRRWTGGRSGSARSLLSGMAFGVAFHLTPTLLPVMLGCMAFELWWARDRRRWFSLVVMALGVALACVPWAWRNYAVFHEFFFIRSNLGLELRVAHHQGAAADIEVTTARGTLRHPGRHPEEARMVRELGEMEYMRRARREALEWIRTHPAAFLRLTGMRVFHFWCGPLRLPWMAAGITLLTILALLGARRTLPALSTPQRAALLIPLATYPLIYYLVSYIPGYRVPLDWILLMFAGAELWHWIRRR